MITGIITLTKHCQHLSFIVISIIICLFGWLRRIREVSRFDIRALALKKKVKLFCDKTQMKNKTWPIFYAGGICDKL